MATPAKRKSKNTHRFNVILTESQYQRLKNYAEVNEKDMAEVIRELVRTLPIVKEESID
jgi:hypothetical protein